MATAINDMMSKTLETIQGKPHDIISNYRTIIVIQKLHINSI